MMIPEMVNWVLTLKYPKVELLIPPKVGVLDNFECTG